MVNCTCCDEIGPCGTPATVRLVYRCDRTPDQVAGSLVFCAWHDEAYVWPGHPVVSRTAL